MGSEKFESVEAYMTAQGPVKARTIGAVIDAILTRFPELQSKVSWNVPTVHRSGKYVAGISAAKNHLTFSAWSPRIIEDFKARLTGYKVMKNCFHIPVDWEVDGNLLADLVRARLGELDRGIP